MRGRAPPLDLGFNYLNGRCSSEKLKAYTKNTTICSLVDLSSVCKVYCTKYFKIFAVFLKILCGWRWLYDLDQLNGGINLSSVEHFCRWVWKVFHALYFSVWDVDVFISIAVVNNLYKVILFHLILLVVFLQVSLSAIYFFYVFFGKVILVQAAVVLCFLVITCVNLELSFKF